MGLVFDFTRGHLILSMAGKNFCKSKNFKKLQKIAIFDFLKKSKNGSLFYPVPLCPFLMFATDTGHKKPLLFSILI